VVRGVARNDTQGVAWQGWDSQAYDDAWAAPVLVYRASGVDSGALFGWLIVPLRGQRRGGVLHGLAGRGEGFRGGHSA